jgi:predicted nucleic-acid-binding protein
MARLLDMSQELLKRADAREVELSTSEAIISEVVYVLESHKQNGYGLPRERIRNLLYPLLSIRGLQLSHRAVCLRALDIYASTQLDFEDTLLIAAAELEEEKSLYSYDGGIDTVTSVRRQEP